MAERVANRYQVLHQCPFFLLPSFLSPGQFERLTLHNSQSSPSIFFFLSDLVIIFVFIYFK
jgi:hypothetical protein